MKKYLLIFRYLINEVNSFSTLVLQSNYQRVFGPGSFDIILLIITEDEFHADPLALTMLKLHNMFHHGKAVSGNSDIGVCTIRCGEQVQITNW